MNAEEGKEATQEHRPLQVLQWVNSQATQVLLYVCDDCRIFRQEEWNRGRKTKTVYREESLDRTEVRAVRCPGLRCRSCESGEEHRCFWTTAPELRERRGPATTETD